MGSLPRKVWTVTKTGSLGGLRLDSDAIAPPGPGEVRIRVKAVGLNFADVFSVLGLYQAAPPTPFVPGLELCGVVESIGPAATDLPRGTVIPSYEVGDRCMAVVRFGAYATVVNAPAHQTRPVPTEWSFAQGAGFLVQGLTAFYALRGLGDVRKDQKVLVHSAAGGCGTFGVRICKAIGAEPIPVVGSESKKRIILERFPDMREDEVIVRPKRGKRFAKEVRRACSNVAKRKNEKMNTPDETDLSAACDIVMDATMGDYFQGGWENLSKGGGRYVVYGAADLTPSGDLSVFDVFGWVKLAYKYLRRPFVDPTNLPGENKSVMGFNLIWMFHKVVVLGELLRDLAQLNLPPPPVGETFAFDDAPRALRRFQSGETTGKVVLLVDHDEE
jgi:NADPH:quinone reductase-like Zn-dependent oxidoreductase